MAPTKRAALQPPQQQTEKPVTVLVTGFGPFLEKYPRNTSWEIASALPALIPAGPGNPTPIHIHVHHEAIRVAYDTVLDLVPQLHPPNNPILPHADIVLHIGLAAGRSFYTLEKGAHGRGYGAIPDVDGQRFGDEAAEERFPRAKFPEALETSFDSADVLAHWKKNLKSTSGDQEDLSIPDVRISPDAGNFMCGFIYWNSLAYYHDKTTDRDIDRPVAFMHVPDLTDSAEKLEKGRVVAIALIKAIVASRSQAGPGASAGGQAREESNGTRVGTDVNFA